MKGKFIENTRKAPMTGRRGLYRCDHCGQSGTVSRAGVINVRMPNGLHREYWVCGRCIGSDYIMEIGDTDRDRKSFCGWLNYPMSFWKFIGA
jgi:hypothetical protein